MSLKKIVADIKSVRIQGATHIALASLEGLRQTIHSSRAKSPGQLLHELTKAKRLLDNARATEPMLRNYTSGVFHDIDTSSLRSLRESTLHNIARLNKLHRKNVEHIIDIGEQKILKGMTIFTHCHSSTVTNIIKKAQKKKGRLYIVNTEARPLFQGRITAKELGEAGIKVNHYVDSAGYRALKHADIMLIGADAITKKGVINKIGSHMFAKMAKDVGVPVYICTPALKFDAHADKKTKDIVEHRPGKEIWQRPPKNVTVHNPAFDLVDSKDIDGIISELGIFSHKYFLKEVKRSYPWIFR